MQLQQGQHMQKWFPVHLAACVCMTALRVVCSSFLQLVKGDIQSMDLLSFVLQAEEIDTIMHFAAQVGCAQG